MMKQTAFRQIYGTPFARITGGRFNGYHLSLKKNQAPLSFSAAKLRLILKKQKLFSCFYLGFY